MKTYLECIPCFLRQAIDTVGRISDDEAVHEQVVRKVLCAVSEMDMQESPPVMARRIHRLIRGLTGEIDPFKHAKKASNRFVLKLFPELQKKIDCSDDPLETAVRLAIAGNIIDLGAKHQMNEVDDETVHKTIEDSLTAPLAADALDDFREAVSQATDILYLGDNAGEIVFDRLLVEQMPREKITFVVRGFPIINDATITDARESGIANIVNVIDNGSDGPGTILKTCSDEFRRRFETADLIIAKGQGNYETLSGAPKDIFFLLKVKCPVIAGDIGCEVGAMVLQRSAVSTSVTNEGAA
jgi:damage-control phosphatase, subfamily I